MPYGDMPFGLRDIKLTDITGSTQVDLPAGQTLRFEERVSFREYKSHDGSVDIETHADAVEWDLEAGGISLEAYALMTGRAETEVGSTPNQTTTLAAEKLDDFPYFKIYGKVLGDGTGDIHCKIFKAKVTTGVRGVFRDGAFFVMQCSGVAVDDGSNGIWELVQNETADDLPAS